MSLASAFQVFSQNDGAVTKAYYEALDGIGPMGQLATALFRAQKRSTAAKKYRGGAFRRSAYDVKNWSISEICRILQTNSALGITWGWGLDEGTPRFEHVLYVDLPNGQCSFHSNERLNGPDYPGKWNGRKESCETILAFCDQVAGLATRHSPLATGAS